MSALILALLEHSEMVPEIQACLEQAGYELCVVNSFRRAKKLLQDHSFDLIISDVHLENGGSVFDFLRWVKMHQSFRSIPFLLLSLQPNAVAKYLADGVQIAARQLGAAGYISMDKFDPLLMNQHIAELLSGLDKNIVLLH